MEKIVMAEELNVSVELTKEQKQRIMKLRAQQREAEKEIRRLKSELKDADKIEEWKMIHDLKKEVRERLKAQGITWKKFIETPDWFEYAWKEGVRIKTSESKPSGTKSGEADMIKLAGEQRLKVVRRKKRKVKKTGSNSGNSNKSSSAAEKSGIV